MNHNIHNRVSTSPQDIVYMKENPHFLTKEQVQEILTSWKKIHTINGVANETGHSHKTIKKYLKLNGVDYG